MKKTKIMRVNLSFAIAFLMFGAFAALTFSQTKPIPKPTSKPTPKPAVKPTATPKPAATPVPKPKKQIIVSVTSARVRSEPNTQSETLKFADIGTVFTVIGEKKDWANIELSEDKNGWISKTITTKYDDANRGKIFQEIAEKYLKRENLDIKTVRELLKFIPKAADESRTYEIGGDLRLKRLFVLRAALDSIPPDKADKSPYKEFLKDNEDEVIFSEPAGRWYIRSNVFWELHSRYSSYKIGDEIAWQAALNPMPGECEGYINCHIYSLRATVGEYLNFYPNGKHSKEALNNLTNMLQPMTADANVRQVYYSANDTSDRAEFNRLLTELRAIVAKLAYVEKSKTLAQIETIAEGFR